MDGSRFASPRLRHPSVLVLVHVLVPGGCVREYGYVYEYVYGSLRADRRCFICVHLCSSVVSFVAVAPRDNWDVIVIGAGLGGLLTAATLARRGRRGRVWEHAAEVGGRLRSYEVDGYVIDAGAYLWPNLHLDRALAAGRADRFRAGHIPTAPGL